MQFVRERIALIAILALFILGLQRLLGSYHNGFGPARPLLSTHYAIAVVDLPNPQAGGIMPVRRDRRIVASNRFGEKVGWAFFGGVDFHACLWRKGKPHDLGTLGGKSSYACAVNDSGQVVGYAQTAEGENHAFLWESGQMQDLGTFGGGNSHAYALNNQGQVAGDADTVEGVTHAFLYTDGVMRDLGTLGGMDSSARGLNAGGQVVGYADTLQIGPQHAFLWQNGQMTDLNRLLPHRSGWELTEAEAITQTGQIRVEGNLREERHSLLLMPQKTNGETEVGNLP